MNNQEEMKILVGFGRKFKIFLRSEFDFRVSYKFLRRRPASDPIKLNSIT